MGRAPLRRSGSACPCPCAPCAHLPPLGAGRFAHQGVLGVRGKAFDVARATRSCPFLRPGPPGSPPAVASHPDAATPARAVRRQIGARLHVVAARAVETVAVDTRPGSPASVPTGCTVSMCAQDQDAGTRIARARGWSRYSMGPPSWARRRDASLQPSAPARSRGSRLDDARHRRSMPSGKFDGDSHCSQPLMPATSLFSAWVVWTWRYRLSGRVERRIRCQATCWPARRASSASSGILAVEPQAGAHGRTSRGRRGRCGHTLQLPAKRHAAARGLGAAELEVVAARGQSGAGPGASRPGSDGQVGGSLVSMSLSPARIGHRVGQQASPDDPRSAPRRPCLRDSDGRTWAACTGRDCRTITARQGACDWLLIRRCTNWPPARCGRTGRRSCPSVISAARIVVHA